MSSKWDWVLFALIAAYPWLFVWQGLDITDFGYLSSNYQQFFHHPENTWFSGPIWLSNFIGAVWNEGFGSYGLVSFKIAYAFVVNITSLIVFMICSPLSNRITPVLAALLATVVFCSSGFTNWLSYNDLTALFYVLASYCVYRGVTGSQVWLVVAGILVGLNIFIRLPNLAGLGFVIVILGAGFLAREQFSESAKKILMFIAGAIVSVLLVWQLMIYMGHWPQYLESIQALYEVTAGATKHHSAGGMLQMLWFDHKKAALYGVLAVAVLLLISRLTSLLRPENYVVILISVCVAILSVGFLLELAKWKWLVPGLLYLLLLSIIVDEKNMFDFRLVALIGLFILFVTPLGSGNGIRNATFGMWIAMPVVLVFLLSRERFKFAWFSLDGQQLVFFRSIIICTLFFFSLYVASYFTYRDSDDRLDLRYQVNHPMLTGLYTTKARAEVLNQVLDELKKHVNGDEYLLAYDYVSGLNFITETQPYLYSSWPLIYSPEQLRRRIYQAEQSRGLPVVVRATVSTFNSDWPSENRGLLKSGDYKLNREIIGSFVDKHQYRVIWTNGCFEILRSNNK